MKQEITIIVAFSYIIKMLRSFPAAMSVMLWVAVIWAIDLSLRPYILKIMLNRAADSANVNSFESLFYPAALYLTMCFLISTSFRFYDYFVVIKMIPNLRKKIADNALNLLVDKSHHYYQNNFSGSLANKINDLTTNVPNILQIVVDRFLSHGLALLIAIYTLWQVDFRFAIFMLFWSIIFILGAVLFSKRLTVHADIWSECSSIITGKLVDVFSNILSVRLFSAKTQEKKFIGEACRDAVEAEQKLEWDFFKMWLFYGYSFCLLQALNIYFLIKGRQDGWISIGDFALVLGVNIAIVDCMWQLAKDFSQFSKILGKIIQALKAIYDPPEIVDYPRAKTLQIREGKIVFDKVNFHYKGTDPLFKDKSLIIAPGQKVGLVGYSGSGKTTFANLILRIYDVTEGRILIDDQDISQVTQDSLRDCIGMIPQDPSLFHRSMMENIRYGKIGASDEEVVEAAKRAHAHEFISRIPTGYNSLVGERGVKISGGQRQRIAIARAMLKNAPILILDEATSQLDSLTESYIQESLWKLMQGKTTLIVAHRLSTLLNMDRILVFDKGQIIEDGAHQELLDKNGLYATLWSSQVGGFLPEKRVEAL